MNKKTYKDYVFVYTIACGLLMCLAIAIGIIALTFFNWLYDYLYLGYYIDGLGDFCTLLMFVLPLAIVFTITFNGIRLVDNLNLNDILNYHFRGITKIEGEHLYSATVIDKIHTFDSYILSADEAYRVTLDLPDGVRTVEIDPETYFNVAKNDIVTVSCIVYVYAADKTLEHLVVLPESLKTESVTNDVADTMKL